MLYEDRRERQTNRPGSTGVGDALDKIQQAQRLLDRAAQDLCPVDGFADEWRMTCELYEKVRNHWHTVEARRAEISRSRLVLAEDSGGPRYTLFGREVHAGDRIQFDEGYGWAEARFEWTHRTDDRPELYLEDGTVRPLPEHGLFRWPER